MEMDWNGIISHALTALGGGGVAGLAGWRLSRRKARAEVKQDEIEVVRRTMEDVYKPIIDSLNKRVQDMEAELKELRGEVKRLREERDECRKHLAAMQATLDRMGTARKATPSGRVRDSRTGRYVKGS